MRSVNYQISIKMYTRVVQITTNMYNEDMIQRNIEQAINEYVSEADNKILFIWGPRRSGKTTLLKKLADKLGERLFNFDFADDREVFQPNRNSLEKAIKGRKIILIDEVQNSSNATVALKLIHDEFNIKIIATGSSELRQTTNDFDSLSGRYIEKYCLPLSIDEIVAYHKPDPVDLARFISSRLSSLLVYGAYPEVYLTSIDEDAKQDLLNNILNTYVLKDIINIYNLRDLKLAKDILTKIALQIGSEVSLREIANSLQANVTTVSNYIEIFVKNYILICLPSFKTNARRAVSENKKYYFYDLGLRNALIKDFRDVDLRQDFGSVFENYVISEIEKIKREVSFNFSTYFYREYNGKEVDLVLESYKKEYKIAEIKLKKDVSTQLDIFPLKHEGVVINSHNFYEELNRFRKSGFLIGAS